MGPAALANLRRLRARGRERQRDADTRPKQGADIRPPRRDTTRTPGTTPDTLPCDWRPKKAASKVSFPTRPPPAPGPETNAQDTEDLPPDPLPDKRPLTQPAGAVRRALPGGERQAERRHKGKQAMGRSPPPPSVPPPPRNRQIRNAAARRRHRPALQSMPSGRGDLANVPPTQRARLHADNAHSIGDWVASSPASAAEGAAGSASTSAAGVVSKAACGLPGAASAGSGPGFEWRAGPAEVTPTTRSRMAGPRRRQRAATRSPADGAYVETSAASELRPKSAAGGIRPAPKSAAAAAASGRDRPLRCAGNCGFSDRGRQRDTPI